MGYTLDGVIKMKIVGVIPARYESTRFPGKPLALICGKPMIYWVYHQTLKVNGLDEIYVATESQQIVDVCKKYGIQVLMTSDKHKTGTDRLGEVASLINADYYINIQGDEPLIEPETVEKVVRKVIENSNCSVINSMTKINIESDINSNTCVKVASNARGKLVYLSRSPIPYPKNGQNITYYKHLGLYGLKRDALLWFAKTERGRIEQIEDIEMMRFLENGYEIEIVEVDSDTIAVDRPEDVHRVENEMKRRMRK